MCVREAVGGGIGGNVSSGGERDVEQVNGGSTE